jgi:hypothetical protein
MWCNPLRPCHCDRDEWAPVRLIVAAPVVFACSWLALTTSPIFWIPLVAAAVFARNAWRVAGALTAGLAAGWVNAHYPTDFGMVLALVAAATVGLIVTIIYCVVTEGAPELDELLALVRRPVVIAKPTRPDVHPLHAAHAQDWDRVTVTRTTTTVTEAATYERWAPPAPRELPADIGWIDVGSQLADRPELEPVRRQLTPPPKDD